MSVQRFAYIPRYHTEEGEFGGYFDDTEDGDFVKFSDFAEREQRIALMAEALNDCIEVLESVHHEVGYNCDGTRCPEGKAISKARAALAATEGENQ